MHTTKLHPRQPALMAARLISVERFYQMYRYDHDGYLTLFPRLAQVGNLEACFIVGMIVVLRDPVMNFRVN